MLYSKLFKVLCLFFIATAFVLAEEDECTELQAYFDGREDKIITINDCETENGKIVKLSVQRDWDYVVPEEEETKILSYESIEILYLQGFDVNENLIKLLSELPKLRQLTTIYMNFIDIDLSPLKKLSRKLEKLELIYNWYEGNIFERLAFLKNLKMISFFELDITNDHIKAISKFKKLIELRTICWNGYDKNITFSPLKDIKITTVEVGVAGGELRKNIINGFKYAEYLLIEDVQFTQDSINEIANLSNLKELIITDSGFTNSVDYNSLKKLKKLTTLEIVSKDNQEKFEEIPEFVYSLTNLKRLVIKGQNIDIIPNKLSQLTNLEYIDFSFNTIDSELPESLNSLSKLKYINFEGNRNLTGKTLTNDNLEFCFYEKHFTLCKAKDMQCLDNLGLNFNECVADDHISTNGQCGKGYGRCPSGKCCSKYGWCGTGENFCSISFGCNSDFGECTSDENSDPSPSNVKCGEKDGKCPSGQCCNKDGYCGEGNSFCSVEKGCQKEFGTCYAEVPLSTNGKCGKGKGRCTSGQCCSKHGWCGTTESHCAISAGCQSEFGKCY